MALSSSSSSSSSSFPCRKSRKHLTYLFFLLLLLPSSLVLLIYSGDTSPPTTPLSTIHHPEISHLSSPIHDAPPTQLSQQPTPTPATTTTRRRRNALRRSKQRSMLMSLRPTPKSRLFSRRARDFLTNSTCNSRFFMTWFSPLDSFTSRELLAVESLFKSYANENPCLLFLSSTLDTEEGRRILQPFKNLGFNLAAMSPDYAFLLRGTPAETWLEQLLMGLISPGDIPFGQNLSNLIRLAVLYRYGGTYLDTDVIVMRSFSDLRNTIGAQSQEADGNWTRLNSAVLSNFDVGNYMVLKFMEEFAETFDGNRWGYNGPYLLSRVVEREGQVGVKVVSPEVFYPVSWTRVGGWFRAPRDRRESRWVEQKVRWLKDRSYGLHLWNRESKGLVVEEGSVIATIVKDTCLLCNYSYSYSFPSSLSRH